MNWAALFYTMTIWLLAASLWQMFAPLPETSEHREAALRLFRDIAPAVLLGILAAMVL